MDIFGEMTELHLLRSSAIPIIARIKPRQTCDSRSRSSVGRALDSVWWQNTSRCQKSGVRGATGARCLSSILAGLVADGGRP